MARLEALFGLGLVVAGVGMAMLAAGFPAAGDALGAAFLPLLVSAALIVLGTIVAVRSGRSRSGTAAAFVTTSDRSRLALAIGALTAFYAALVSIEGLGFPVLAPVLLIGLAFAFGGRLSLGSIVTAVTVSEGAYVVFRHWFGLPLPSSAWF